MKILIIGLWFPPANVIGAIRLGELDQFLAAIHRGPGNRRCEGDA